MFAACTENCGNADGVYLGGRKCSSHITLERATNYIFRRDMTPHTISFMIVRCIIFDVPIDSVVMMASKRDIFLSMKREQQEKGLGRVLARFAPISSI